MKLKIAAAMVVAILMSAFAGAEVDRSTPENTIKSFIKALAESDYDGIISCIKGAKRNEEMAKSMSHQKGDMPSFEITVTDVKVDGDKATCAVTVVTSSKNMQPETISDSINLERTGDAWQIAPLTGQQDPKRIINMLASIMADQGDMFVKAKQAAKKAACLSNIKQIALGFMMVAADNDDYFKVQANAWKKALMPYIKNEALFTCPLDPKGTVSYSINPAMAGFNVVKVKDPAKTVLLYEGSKGKLNFRHGGYAAVAFADGHAKMVNAEQAKSLIWKP